MNKSIYMLIFVLVFLFTIFIGLKEAGNFLVINEEPIESDVIIILSGGGIERLEKSVELYKLGYAPYMMISNGMEDNLYGAALNMEIPNEVLFIEGNATSTKENALFTKELMNEHHFTSAIVVSTDYHMRRVKANFSQVFSDRDIRLTYSSVSENKYNPEEWWATKRDIKTTFIEYIKLGGNYFGIHGTKAKERLNKISIIF